MNYNQFSRQSTNKEEWKLVDKFDSTYWSGLDVQIYTNNILVDEAIQCNYQIVEQVRPYYGYASYIPDRLYHGTRIIAGELSLNFKRDGYLFSLISLLRKQNQADIWLPSNSPQSTNDTTNSKVRAPIEFINTPWGPQTAQQIKSGNMSPEAIAQYVKAKKQAASEEVLSDNRFRPDVSSNLGMFETKKEGFDINIIFGADMNTAKTLRFLSDDSYEAQGIEQYYADGAVQQDAGTSSTKGIAAGTGLKIIGVSITSLAKTIADDGRPLIETYSFTARDVQILKNEDLPSLGATKSISGIDATLNRPGFNNTTNARNA